MKLRSALFLAATAIVAFGLGKGSQRRLLPPPELEFNPRAATPPPMDALSPAVDEATQDSADPGGQCVVITLIAMLGGIACLAAAFLFPPAYVAACLAFGPVTLIGSATLYLHYRVHARETDRS